MGGFDKGFEASSFGANMESGIDIGESKIDTGEMKIDTGELAIDNNESVIDIGESKIDTGDAEIDTAETEKETAEVYREGEALLPDKQYEVNGYHYETDHLGRISKAEGQLRIEEGYKRNMENVTGYEGQEYRPTDDRGHLIAHEFGGSDRLENLVPMDSAVNERGEYRAVERKLESAVKDGADVNLKVEPKYDGESRRPSDFKVTYTIDGEKEITMIKNGGEA